MHQITLSGSLSPFPAVFHVSYHRTWCSLLESWWHELSCTFLKQFFVMLLCIVVRIHWWEFLDGKATLCSFLQIASYLTVVADCLGLESEPGYRARFTLKQTCTETEYIYIWALTWLLAHIQLFSYQGFPESGAACFFSDSQYALLPRLGHFFPLNSYKCCSSLTRYPSFLWILFLTIKVTVTLMLNI